MPRTLTVEERELDNLRCIHARHGLCDVLEPRLLQLSLLRGVRGVADEVLGDERLMDRGAPVRGGLGEDRAQLRGRVGIYLRVVVGKIDRAVREREISRRDDCTAH